MPRGRSKYTSGRAKYWTTLIYRIGTKAHCSMNCTTSPTVVQFGWGVTKPIISQRTILGNSVPAEKNNNNNNDAFPNPETLYQSLSASSSLRVYFYCSVKSTDVSLISKATSTECTIRTTYTFTRRSLCRVYGRICKRPFSTRFAITSKRRTLRGGRCCTPGLKRRERLRDSCLTTSEILVS